MTNSEYNTLGSSMTLDLTEFTDGVHRTESGYIQDGKDVIQDLVL